MDQASKAPGRIGTLRREFESKVRLIGLPGAVRLATVKLFRQMKDLGASRQSDPFDLKYGTDTARIVRVGGLDIPDDKLDHASRYEAVLPDAFFAMMRELPVAHEDFVFVDLGSGKGRALLLASHFPFIEIVGVEISNALTEIALNNIRVFKSELQKCHRIRAVCGDATRYELPRTKVVLYMYNPFDEQVMSPAVSAIEASLRCCPRKVFVIYLRPLQRHVWNRSRAFHVLKSAERYVIYESKTS